MSLNDLWAWFIGLFKRKTFKEVPLLPIEEPSPVEESEEPPEEPVPELPEDFIFSCSDGAPVPTGYWGNASLLATNLRILAQELGKPLVLISVYRTPEYNKKVGGREGSSHLSCAAVDFTVSGMEPVEVVDKMEELMCAGKMSRGLKALHPGYIHYEFILPY